MTRAAMMLYLNVDGLVILCEAVIDYVQRWLRNAYRAKRKRLEKTGVLYTPPDQQVKKVRRAQQS